MALGACFSLNIRTTQCRCRVVVHPNSLSFYFMLLLCRSSLVLCGNMFSCSMFEPPNVDVMLLFILIVPCFNSFSVAHPLNCVLMLSRLSSIESMICAPCASAIKSLNNSYGLCWVHCGELWLSDWMATVLDSEPGLASGFGWFFCPHWSIPPVHRWRWRRPQNKLCLRAHTLSMALGICFSLSIRTTPCQCPLAVHPNCPPFDFMLLMYCSSFVICQDFMPILPWLSSIRSMISTHSMPFCHKI